MQRMQLAVAFFFGQLDSFCLLISRGAPNPALKITLTALFVSARPLITKFISGPPIVVFFPKASRGGLFAAQKPKAKATAHQILPRTRARPRSFREKIQKRVRKRSFLLA